MTYGVTYGVQFAPSEQDGKQVVEVWAATNQPLENLHAYFQNRNNALSNGGFFASGPDIFSDSTFGFSPIRHIPGWDHSSKTDWRDFGPRVSVAWNLPWKNRVFGDKQTVIRAGYALLWNRTNGVGEALTPLLGDGLASALTCNGPVFATPASTTASCSGNKVDATNGFRLGVDGTTIPIPALANAPIPLIPGSPFDLSRSGLQDPNIRPGYSHNFTLDVQRAFAGGWLVDIGYIGRLYRNLWENVDINAVDPKAKTPACSAGQAGCNIPTSGQTLAQAYDAIYNGSTAAQPFFENAPYGCVGCTAIAALDAGDPSLATFMLFNYDSYGAPVPRPMDPLQGVVNNTTTDGFQSNYHALFVSARKSFGHGLEVNFNYTWSHSYGWAGGNFLNQEYTFYSPPTPFDYSSGTGSNNGDRRHAINLSWYYLLPFGKGRTFATSNNILDRAIGGWYVSGIWFWGTGRPVCIGADGDYGTPDGFTCAVGTFFGKASRYSAYGAPGAVAANGNPASGGTGLNIFKDPGAVYAALGTPLPGVIGRPNAENLNEPRAWNVDLSVGKNVLMTERYKLVFTADFFNLPNHPLLGTNATAGSVSLDLANPHGFGVVTAADNTPRVIQFGLRFEF
jgi:hypothetical protein